MNGKQVAVNGQAVSPAKVKALRAAAEKLGGLAKQRVAEQAQNGSNYSLRSQKPQELATLHGLGDQAQISNKRQNKATRLKHHASIVLPNSALRNNMTSPRIIRPNPHHPTLPQPWRIHRINILRRVNLLRHLRPPDDLKPVVIALLVAAVLDFHKSAFHGNLFRVVIFVSTEELPKERRMPRCFGGFAVLTSRAALVAAYSAFEVFALVALGACGCGEGLVHVVEEAEGAGVGDAVGVCGHYVGWGLLGDCGGFRGGMKRRKDGGGEVGKLHLSVGRIASHEFCCQWRLWRKRCEDGKREERW
jgi:hypothetical protein